MSSDLYELLSHEVANFARGGLSSLGSFGIWSRSSVSCWTSRRRLCSPARRSSKRCRNELLETGSGGTIFLITSPRPTQESDNDKCSQSFYPR